MLNLQIEINKLSLFSRRLLVDYRETRWEEEKNIKRKFTIKKLKFMLTQNAFPFIAARYQI